jgi:tRNA threonylcarbamoyl adenosine modification protein (Sua5/YciO/YrdC/YwlC family)
MSQFFQIHPDNPQHRLIGQAADMVRAGGIIVLPTDSCYALACRLDDKGAADRLRRIRQIDAKHNLTLLCRDLREIASYAHVDNTQFRMLKAAMPGSFTFIL